MTDLLTAGRRLKSYELLAPIARGGMGTVWLARMDAQGSRRLVAVKTIVSQYRDDPKFRDMFLDEARLSALIDHPNVAKILEIGEDGGVLFYAMEYIDGDPLRRLQQQLLERGQTVPLNIALRVCADACAGLHAAHETRDGQGNLLEVVHRDVSPHNILVGSSGAVKIIDFGVAKARHRIVAESTAGTFKGKIDFMAPEQARGGHIDRRADVYAIGASLFHLITGRAVYDSSEGRQLAALHELISGAARAALPDTVPGAIRHVIDRALAHEPDERFATCEDLRVALEHAMVACDETATSQEVAAILDATCPDRAKERGNLIQFAIQAAEERNGPEAAGDPIGGSLLGAEMSNGASGAHGRPSYSIPLMALSGVVLGFVVLFALHRVRDDSDIDTETTVVRSAAAASHVEAPTKAPVLPATAHIPIVPSGPPPQGGSVPAIPVVSAAALPASAPVASSTKELSTPPKPANTTSATPGPTHATSHSPHSAKPTKPKGSTSEYGF